MKKVLGVIAALAIVGASGVANAADAQNDSVKQPAEISATDMDSVTAGLDAEGTSVRAAGSKTMGAYTYTYDGKRWTRVRNR